MTEAPLFSIVIPTRERHRTLEASMRSVLSQQHDSFELVVMDNFSGSETREVVEAFRDSRVRYHRSNRRLSMAGNWEAGLAQAKGQFVTILGDDDALTVDSLQRVEALLGRHQVAQLGWQRAHYWWPDALEAWRRNCLWYDIRLDESFVMMSSAAMELFCRFMLSFNQLPMLYNAFVGQSIIEKVKSRTGRYFNDACPDVYSGIANTICSDRFAYTWYPLSISGLSGASTGASFFHQLGKDGPSAAFVAENKHDDLGGVELIPREYASGYIANVIVNTLRCLEGESPRWRLDQHALIEDLLSEAGVNRDAYDDIVATIRFLTPFAEGRIPARPDPSVTPPDDFLAWTERWIHMDKRGAMDVYAASQVLHRVMTEPQVQV